MEARPQHLASEHVYQVLCQYEWWYRENGAQRRSGYPLRWITGTTLKNSEPVSYTHLRAHETRRHL
eukprot:4824209-Prorocentrum_lima.AAC.1